MSFTRSSARATTRLPKQEGQYSAPVDMENIPLFTGFYTSQMVQDFFHQQYFGFLDLQDAILRKLVDGCEVGGSPVQLRCIFSVGPKKIGQKVWRYPLVS